MKKINYSREEHTSELLPTGLLESSEPQGWKNIHFQYYELGGLEVPDHAPLQDAFISIHKPTNKAVKRILDGKKHETIDHLGDVTLAPAGYGHSVAWDAKASFSIISFEANYLASLVYDLHHPNKFLIRPHFAQQDPAIYGIAQTLKLICNSRKPVSQLYLDAIGVFVANHLIVNYTEGAILRGLCNSDLQKVIDYMQANLHLNIGLSELSSLLSMSQSYFSKLFKMSTGVTPYEYLTRCRIKKVKELLKKTSLSLDEIASRTGFSNKYHLSQSFSQRVSVSPIKYRRLP